MGHWSGPRRRAIQAGAHIGIWPRRLVELFDHVVCFEPEPENVACVVENLSGVANVEFHSGVLVEFDGIAHVSITRKSTANHFVSRRTSDSIQVRGYSIDGLGFDDVDAIFLDVEGGELPALRGAARTIAKSHPLIVAEECKYCERFGHREGDIADFLKTLGYEQVGRVGVDLVFR